MNSADLVLTLGAFGGMLAGFFAISKTMLTSSVREREADRKERIILAHAIEKMAESSDKVAQATVKSALEAELRNGHLGEQNVEIVRLVASQNRDVSNIKLTNKKIADILSKSALIAAEDKELLIEQHVVDKQEVKEY